MNIKILLTLFFIFLVGTIPIGFAEEKNQILVWEDATWETKYTIHFQAQIRSQDGSLLSVTESFSGTYLSNVKNTDLLYSGIPLKKIVEISNKEYEMRQFEETWRATDGDFLGVFEVGYVVDGLFHDVFHAYPPTILVEKNNIVTIQWTIFKKI